MLDLSNPMQTCVAAPPLVPSRRAIDCDHLARMTLGDRALEREVLGLFRQQAAMLRARMLPDEADVAGAAAHTLKGSAVGVGAWRVAQAALAVEQAAGSGHTDDLQFALDTLDTALRDTIAEIAEDQHADLAVNPSA